MLIINKWIKLHLIIQSVVNIMSWKEPPSSFCCSTYLLYCNVIINRVHNYYFQSVQKSNNSPIIIIVDHFLDHSVQPRPNVRNKTTHPLLMRSDRWKCNTAKSTSLSRLHLHHNNIVIIINHFIIYSKLTTTVIKSVKQVNLFYMIWWWWLGSLDYN